MVDSGRFPYFYEPFVRTEKGVIFCIADVFQGCGIPVKHPSFHRSHHHDGRPGILSARWSSWGLQWGEECGCGGLSHHPQRVWSKWIPACQLELNEPPRIIWFITYLQECSAQDAYIYIGIYPIFDIFGWFWTCKPQQKAIGIRGLALRKLS